MKTKLCALAILSATSLPVLAESVSISVTGTIIPPACKINLPGGDEISYETLSSDILDATGYTVLEGKTAALTINCKAPTKVGLVATNQRTNSLAGATENAAGVGAVPVTLFDSAAEAGVGLGASDGKKVGGYGIRLDPTTITVDTKSVDIINKLDSASAWTKNTSGNLYNTTGSQQVSWATTGQVQPVAFTNLSADLGVEAYINKRDELDLGKIITLNGLTTIEMVYL